MNVYSGNIRALVNSVEDPEVGPINTGSRDHLVEQLMSVDKWGKVFNIEPIPDRIVGMLTCVYGLMSKYFSFQVPASYMGYGEVISRFIH